jgi:hypothetical protein
MPYPQRVPRFGEFAEWLELTTDRFDHTSELPPDANAGNRFYGRDVAEFVCAGLTGRGIEARVVEEDWGWLVLSRPRDGVTLEIAVYHNLEEDAATENTWRLMVRQREKRLLFPTERPVDSETLQTLEDLFRDAGIESRRLEGDE